MEIVNIGDWGLNIPKTNFHLIAGPCSAETRAQVLQSCEGAAKSGAHILRAGVWKPRTRPGSFQGVGVEGLPWIKEAGEFTSLPVTVEVAHPAHVEAALKHEVDILWIGARSSANPFTVQEIANALKGVDVPIFIKNPVNPDLELWIGAIERLHHAGLKKIALIFRGVSVYKSAPFRNAPMWQIPIELRRRYPQFEILCDPSHIAGRRELLQALSQKALDLDFNGLMIETHINPDEALSDAAQQLTPSALKMLLDKLVHRSPESDDPDFIANLEALRYDIDRLDSEVIELLSKRMEVSQEIGRYKKQTGVTIFQLERWSELFNQRVTTAIQTGLSTAFAREFIQSIHNESIRQQMHIVEDEELE